jgi:hypothetical protein
MAFALTIDMSSPEVQELAPYIAKASRVELIVRWLYGIVIGLVLAVWQFWYSLCVSIHFWYILILGRRSSYLYRQTRRYIAALAYESSYLSFLTDSRPQLTPNLILYTREADSEAPKQIPPPRPNKFCVSCGAEVPAAVAFCPKCGAGQ